MLRAGGTQAEAARAAGVGVSTIKRWLADPQFRAMVSSSPDIRLGPPPNVGQSRDVPDSRGDMRSQMWVSSESQEVIGSYIPPAVFERMGAVLHIHVVPSAEVADVISAIGTGTYPTELPYIPVPLDGLAELLENLPLVCRLGSREERESLDAWLELWTFVDEDGRHEHARGWDLGWPAPIPRGAPLGSSRRLCQVAEGRPLDTRLARTLPGLCGSVT